MEPLSPMKTHSENYAELIKRLFSINLHRGIKLGLEKMEAACNNLGHPETQFKSIHIAGTNGKGSVSTKIAKSLTNTGLFTSPHIASFRERIQIDSNLISEEEVIELLPPLFEEDLTFFEMTTLLAFIYFAQKKVDWAAVEVGLGGRLDATNVITPELSIITSISLEHTEILGTDIDSIAREKGGIIKPNIPVVVGPRCPPILEAIAKSKNAPYIKVEGNFNNYDEENSAIAKAALDFLKLPTYGISCRPRCRFEKIGNYILDVAHNPDGMRALTQMLTLHYPGQTFDFIVGLSKSKDIDTCLKILTPFSKRFIFVEAENGRGLSAQELSQKVKNAIPSTLPDAIKITPHLTIITGTFFIMHQALKQLGINIPSDQIDINERKALIIN